MEKFLVFVQAYAQWMILGMLIIQLMAILISMHKITAIRKQIRKIANEVQGYLQVVLETEDENLRETEKKRKSLEKEKQTELISSVLEEIFP